MSDEVNNSVMVDDYYAEPFDIVKYINTDNADEFMSFLIDEAIDFYVENEYSPIIEQQKFDGFVIDYYFIADCLSKFIENVVLKSVEDEKFVKNVRSKFKSDFTGEGELFWKNARLLLSVLSFLDIVASSVNARYIFAQTAYSYVSSSIGDEEVFLLKSVFLNNKKTEKYKTNLIKIGSKAQYKMLGFGQRAISNLALKLLKKEKKLRQF